MRKLVILLFLSSLSCIATTSQAQRYVVYTLIGNPTLSVGKVTRQLKLREELMPSSVISIPADSKIELFDEANRKQYILKTPGRATIASFIKDNRNNVVTLTDRYYRYILSQVHGNNETIIRSCSDPATITREELVDSMNSQP